MTTKPADFIGSRRQLSAVGTITTVAGNGSNGFSGNGGPATAAKLNYPRGVAVDTSGNIFIADTSNHVIRKVSKTSGFISIAAGTAGNGDYTGDGGAAISARLNNPHGVAVDLSGNIYIADTFNHLIRVVTNSTGYISRVAGTPHTVGFDGDGFSASSATLNYPVSVAVDVSGNIYIADSYNHVIRMVKKSTGTITTVAGTPGSGSYSGDGGSAISAALYYPQGVALDVAGNIYIADTGNFLVRMVTSSTKKITLIAGIPGLSGYTNDCGPATAARLQLPFGISVDTSGNIYIADSASHIVRIVVKSTGIISIVAGKPYSSGYNGDGGPATSAAFIFPVGVVADGAGNIYVVDLAASTVRKVTGASPNPCPSAPTAVPTATPTTVPTSTPTAVPTTVPTSSPTDLPTAMPTATPTSSPTDLPTDRKSVV